MRFRLAIIFLLMGFIAQLLPNEENQFFSVDSLSLDSIEAVFEDVEIIKDYSARDLIIQLIANLPRDSSTVMGLAKCKIFIDEEGKLKAAIVIESDNDSVGGLAIRHIKEAIFMPRVDESSIPSSYGLEIRYYFSGGRLAGPAEVDFSNEESKTRYPKLKKRQDAKYPREAKKRGITGMVLTRNKINSDGKVETSLVVRSDSRLLNQAAISASRKFRFNSFDEKDFPDGCWMVFPFQFRIQ